MKVLRALADNGGPLELRVETREGKHFIRRDGGPEVEYTCWNPTEELRHRLAHYPREVRINGKKMETKPEPELAEVVTLRPSGRDMSGDSERKLELGEPERNPAFNALIGGVWNTIRQDRRDGDNNPCNHTYFSLMPGDAQHHQLLATVRLKLHLEVRTEEISMLRRSGSVWEFTAEPELQKRMEQRLEEMLERTLRHPAMPPRYEGRVHTSPLVGHTGSDQHITEAPIAVTGTPVIIDQDGREGPENSGKTLSNGGFISIVEALYQSDSKLVPVSEDRWAGTTTMEGAGDEAVIITGAEPIMAHQGSEHPDGITLRLQVEDWEENPNEEVLVPARFWITGDPGASMKVSVVPGSMTSEELGGIMLRALWDEEQYDSSEHAEQAREEMEEKLHNLAQHHLEGGNQAVLQELQWAADRFDSMVPLPPDQRLSATSHDGRITVILNQAGAGT